MAESEDDIASILLPCTICNRTFKPESLEKHKKVCEKNATKKRKTFDSSKQRKQGTELAEFLPVIPKKEKSPFKKPKSLWKQKHLEFVRAIREARGVEVPGKRTLSTVEQSRPANHEKCPHCERNFGPKAFDRHIEWCKEQKTRIPKSPANTVAKERLEARTKYRAPLSKTKRSITREKYTPVLRGREPSPKESASTMVVTNSCSNQTVAMPSIRGNAPRTSGSAPSLQRSSVRESLTSPTHGVRRNTNSQTSVPRRSSSPTKRPSLVRKDSMGIKRESTTPSPKKNSTSEGVQDLFTSSCNITRIGPGGRSKSKSLPATNAPVVNAARSKNKKNDVRSNSIASGEVYDPYVSAERQMLELLSGDWSEPVEKKNEPEKKQEVHVPEPEPQVTEPVSSPSPPNNELRTSPTSAFTKYSPIKPKTDVPVEPERSDEKTTSFDFDELIISGLNTSSIPSPQNISLSAITSLFDENDSNLNDHKELMLSLSSICSIPNFDLNFELDANVNRKSNRGKYRRKLESAALALQQSVSLYHPGPTVEEESQLQVEEVDNHPLNSEIDVFSSPLQTISLLSLSSPEPKLTPISSVQNCEDSDYSRLGPLKRFGDAGKNSAIGEEEPDSHINRRSFGSKISGDSAYSSLNRKSPLADATFQGLERHAEVLLDTDVRCLSSSGSESSLPPLCSTQVESHRGKSPLLSSTPTPSVVSSTDQSALKMSKFCHECGSKYPVSLAKFCCECGVRRLFV